MAGAALDGGPLVDGVVQRVARWKTGRGRCGSQQVMDGASPRATRRG